MFAGKVILKELCVSFIVRFHVSQVTVYFNVTWKCADRLKIHESK